MSIHRSEVAKARQLVDNLNALVADGSGGLGYRPYADKVLEDISGLEQVATKILASKNPMVSATRLINHPFSRSLASLLIGTSRSALSAVNDLTVVAFQAAQIAMRPRSKTTKTDVASYKYLQKLYRKGISALKEQYGYAKSQKKFYKDQFSDLRSFIDDDGEYSHFFGQTDDDDYDDDDDELAALLEQGRLGMTDTATLPSMKSGTRQEPDDLSDALSWVDMDGPRSDQVPDEFFRELFSLRRDPKYSPGTFEGVNYDFTGKTSLALIADRMESLLEGMQLILNRIYGREVDFIPPDDTSSMEPTQEVGLDADDDDDGEDQAWEGQPPFYGLDFSHMTRRQLIDVFNNVGLEFAKAISRKEDAPIAVDGQSDAEELPAVVREQVTDNPDADEGQYMDMPAERDPDGARTHHVRHEETPSDTSDGALDGSIPEVSEPADASDPATTIVNPSDAVVGEGAMTVAEQFNDGRDERQQDKN